MRIAYVYISMDIWMSPHLGWANGLHSRYMNIYFLMNFACHLICSDAIIFFRFIKFKQNDSRWKRLGRRWIKRKISVLFHIRWSILVARFSCTSIQCIILFAIYFISLSKEFNGNGAAKITMNVFALWNRIISGKSAGHSNESPSVCRRRRRLWQCNE